MSDNNGRPSEPSDGLHGVSCYAEVRFFKWQEADTSVSLRNKSGSYGGGSEVLVIERHFGSEVRLYEDVVPTLKKNMGDGGATYRW